MKKIGLAAIAAMVLSSGVMAEDIFGKTMTSLTSPVISLGAGWSQVSGSGDSGVMISIAPQLGSELDSVSWAIEAEGSDNYKSLLAKSYILVPNGIDGYFGIGYMNAENTYAEDKGAFWTLGAGKTLAMDDFEMKVFGGYKFGGVRGPSATLDLGQKNGLGVDPHTIGLKVNYERFEEAKSTSAPVTIPSLDPHAVQVISAGAKDINRLGVYLYYSF